MFDKEYSFKGSHAAKVNQLTSKFNQNGNQLFDRNFDVYLIAAIVGFIYARKSELDKVSEPTTKIFVEMLIKEQDSLKFNYRLIMLMDKNNEPDLEKRIEKAFRLYGSPEAHADEQLYEQYVRGGIDILHEKLIVQANNEDDYLKNLYDFLEEFEIRYNQSISTDEILNLCKSVKVYN